jgi:hypothetical protein
MHSGAFNLILLGEISARPLFIILQSINVFTFLDYLQRRNAGSREPRWAKDYIQRSTSNDCWTKLKPNELFNCDSLASLMDVKAS